MPPEEERSPGFAFTPVYLYHGDSLAATVGFNTFELYPTPPPRISTAWCTNQLMLGAGYNWDNDYTVLSDDGTACTASCRIYVEQADGTEAWLSGLLSYRTDLLVYVAIQFEPDTVTSEQMAAIGESISLSPA